MKITRTKIEASANELADRMLAKQPKVKEDKPIEAPYLNDANQPSFYGAGQMAVPSTVRSGFEPGDDDQSWTIKYVRASSLKDYGLPRDCIPDHAYIEQTDKAAIIKRGDRDFWQFSMGQNIRMRGMSFMRAPHIQVHITRPIVLEHLDSHPILCKSHSQAERECERVGAEIRR